MKRHKILKPTSLEAAFSQIEDISSEYPVNAIQFLYNHPPDDRIVKRIVSSIQQYNDASAMYDAGKAEWSNATLWYSIVAENHLDKRQIEPIIKILEEAEDDDMLFEQLSYLVGGLCEKYGDIAVSKFLDGLEEYSQKGEDIPYLYLIDSLYYADVEKHKSRILGFLREDEYWLGSFASRIGDLQIKEAIPIMKKLIVKEEMKVREEEGAYSVELDELKHALKALETNEIEYPDYACSWYQQRNKNWKPHYDKYFGKVNKKITFKTPGRNDPCLCGSGKKYKKCCMKKKAAS